MASGARERRAAKQRRRDGRRGFVAVEGPPTHERGLPPEALRRLLRETAADVAAGDGAALGELRRLLTEHLARRRAEILAACDDVLAEVGEGPAPRGGSAEDAVTATVRRLAPLT